jgi:hypothetical protein
MVRVSHEDFVNKGQMMYGKQPSDTSITTKLRITYRDSLGDEIPNLSNEFDMTVTNPKVADEQDCLQEFVTKEDQISRDLKLVFNQDTTDDVDEFAQIMIESPVNTKWNDETLGCGLRFAL